MSSTFGDTCQHSSPEMLSGSAGNYGSLSSTWDALFTDSNYARQSDGVHNGSGSTIVGAEMNLAPTGATTSATSVFEIAVYGTPYSVYVQFDGGTDGISATTSEGDGHLHLHMWNGVDADDYDYGVWAPSSGTQTIFRFEVSSTSMKVYIGGTLVRTLASGVSNGTAVDFVDVTYAAVNAGVRVLGYVNALLGGSSGALGAPTVADLVAPTLTGSITLTLVSANSYTLSWPAGSDNVAVTDYEYSINSGSWVSTSNSTTVTLSSRPVGTDAVSVRAKDAAGNSSTPPLTISVVVPDATLQELVTDGFEGGAALDLTTAPVGGWRWTVDTRSGLDLTAVRSAFGLMWDLSGTDYSSPGPQAVLTPPAALNLGGLVVVEAALYGEGSISLYYSDSSCYTIGITRTSGGRLLYTGGTSAVAAPGETTLSVLRMELALDARRYYLNGALLVTESVARAALGQPFTKLVFDAANATYASSKIQHDGPAARLRYLRMYQGTTTGAIGAPGYGVWGAFAVVADGDLTRIDWDTLPYAATYEYSIDGSPYVGVGDAPGYTALLDHVLTFSVRAQSAHGIYSVPISEVLDPAVVATGYPRGPYNEPSEFPPFFSKFWGTFKSSYEVP